MMVPSNLRARSYLATTDEAALNRLAGYSWAATMVNLRSPATAVRILADLPRDSGRSLAALADGVSAAVLVWLAMTDDRASVSRLEDALATRENFPNSSAATAIQEAITRRIKAHPCSSEDLGALFSFQPEAPPAE
jgi:hypothetical protein